MAYFGISTERYGGWSEQEKKEALKNADLPPDRKLRENVDEE